MVLADRVKEIEVQTALPQIQKPHRGLSTFQPEPWGTHRSLAPSKQQPHQTKERSVRALVCHLGKSSSTRKPPVTGLGSQYWQKSQHPISEAAEHLPLSLISAIVLTKLFSPRFPGARPINQWPNSPWGLFPFHKLCMQQRFYQKGLGGKKKKSRFFSFLLFTSPPFLNT